MKKSHLFKILGVVFIALLLLQCAEEPEKSLVDFDPDYEVKPDPTISSIEPESAYAGITEVTIHGNNFDPSDGFAHTRVYFGGEKAQILSIEGDSVITCVTPVILGDSIRIKVQVDGALVFGEFQPYRIESAQQEYGGITGAYDAYGLAVDMNENLYLSLGDSRIIYVTPEEEIVVYDTLTSFFKSMKMGPGNELYASRTAFIYKMNGTTYERLSFVPNIINDFDFDQNQNIYFASQRAIYFIDQTGSHSSVANYDQYVLNTIRIFNGYVYTSGNYTGTDTTQVQKGIWRNEILNASGDLGPNELVFDWYSYFGSGAVGIPNILSMTFAEDGDLYVGADSTQISEAITVLHPDGDGDYLPGNTEVLYPAVLVPPATNMVWGNGPYLYVNRRSLNSNNRRIIRVNVGKNSAPYYGRQ